MVTCIPPETATCCSAALYPFHCRRPTRTMPDNPLPTLGSRAVCLYSRNIPVLLLAQT